ncbi:hypothetical protein ASE63_03205 [Bosea sp. Root381]|nr:hypothetical protein ASE63_03205 [Bosea sp. Root381]
MMRSSRGATLSGRERAALALACLASIIVPLLALPGASLAQPAPLAIVFPPWVSGEEAIARSLSAGHRVLRPGRTASIVVVAPADSMAPERPGGAIMVLALAGLAGCLDAAVSGRAAS